MQALEQPEQVPRVPIVLDRFPDAHEGWARLIRDVVGGGAATSRLIAALDRPVRALLVDVDVEAALTTADAEPSLATADAEPALAAADAEPEPGPDDGRGPAREPFGPPAAAARRASVLGAAR